MLLKKGFNCWVILEKLGFLSLQLKLNVFIDFFVHCLLFIRYSLQFSINSKMTLLLNRILVAGVAMEEGTAMTFVPHNEYSYNNEVI